MPEKRRKIDVHTHWLPDFYQDALRAAGITHPDGMPGIPKWNLESHIELMDELGVEKAYLSISAPGTHLVPGKDADSRALCQKINKHGAELKRLHPGRFGMLASLPLPDVEGALAEIDHALDECGAEGFCLLTNTHGIYLGDKRLDKVFEKLNQRKAIVLLHPVTPFICGCASDIIPHEQEDVRHASPLQYPRPMMEFFFDTARACLNLVLSGTVSRHPDIRFIMPHMGGAFPVLIDRFIGFSQTVMAHDKSTPTPDEMRRVIRDHFWYDTAGYEVFTNQYKLLMQFARADHICYGTDQSYTPPPRVKIERENIERDADKALSEYGGSLQGVLWDNAANLFAVSQ